MKKILVTILVIAMIFAFGLTAYADPDDEPETEVTETEVTETEATETPGEIVEDAPEDNLDESTFKKWLDEWRAKYESDQAGKEEPDTFGEWVVMQIWQYGTEILAALAALCAIINAVYAKTKIKKPFDSFSKQTTDNLTKFSGDISKSVEESGTAAAEALELVKSHSNTVESLETRNLELMAKIEEFESERKAMTAAMKIQCEMLNTIIQSSTLSAWKKDQIGQLYTKAAETIDSLEKKADGGDHQ